MLQVHQLPKCTTQLQKQTFGRSFCRYLLNKYRECVVFSIKGLEKKAHVLISSNIVKKNALQK